MHFWKWKISSFKEKDKADHLLGSEAKSPKWSAG